MTAARGHDRRPLCVGCGAARVNAPRVTCAGCESMTGPCRRCGQPHPTAASRSACPWTDQAEAPAPA